MPHNCGAQLQERGPLPAQPAGTGLTNRKGRLPRLPPMATLPPAVIPPQAASLSAGESAPEVLAEAIVALHGQAAALAMLARLAPEPVEIGGELGAIIARAHPWQRALVAQTVADCAAMMDSGLAALGTLTRRGQDTAAPALVLWREFHAARASMVSVLEAVGPA